MMKKTFFVSPRQSGKSIMACYEYIKNQPNCFLLSNKKGMADTLSDRVRYYSKDTPIENIMTIDKFSKIRGVNIKNVIIDEYMFFTPHEKELLRQRLLSENLNEMVIFSTPNMVFDKKLFSYVKKMRLVLAKHRLIETAIEEFQHLKPTHIKTMVNDLYFNFILDDDCNVINTGISWGIDDKTKNEFKHILMDYQYNMEIYAKYLEDNGD